MLLGQIALKNTAALSYFCPVDLEVIVVKIVSPPPPPPPAAAAAAMGCPLINFRLLVVTCGSLYIAGAIIGVAREIAGIKNVLANGGSLTLAPL
ncbi:hypothetical protein GOP47_0025910 [Adiantum capillus-veneris]|uniref:Uncharacterized protein n=1 Tax=Adiantum capillus-veneris TaxID=13818 RepID=A0A9D4Z4K7_ADICA|nr:hypothetical protein GOP47_0025910 [Adiantum capillus-veneris]